MTLPSFDDSAGPLQVMMPKGMICDRHGSLAQDIEGLNLVYLHIVVSARFFSSPTIQREAGRDDATGALAEASKLSPLAERYAPLCCWMGARWWAECLRMAREPIRPWVALYAEIDRVRVQFGEGDIRPDAWPVLVCRTCDGAGMVGTMEDADECPGCDGTGVAPLLDWKVGSLSLRRRLAKMYAGWGLEF